MPIDPYPEFVAQCDDLVDVEVNLNADGSHADAHGGSDPVWSDTPVLTGVACDLVNDGTSMNGGAPFVQVVGGFEVPVRKWRAFFPAFVDLDRNKRLVWRDPDRGGKARYLYVVSDATNQSGRYCKAECYEHVRPDVPSP